MVMIEITTPPLVVVKCWACKQYRVECGWKDGEVSICPECAVYMRALRGSNSMDKSGRLLPGQLWVRLPRPPRSVS